MSWLKKAFGIQPQPEFAFVEVTDDNFQKEVIEAERPVMLFVWSNSCPHCHKMTPNVKNVAARYQHILKAAHTSAHLAPRAMNALEVRGVPALLFFEDGHLVGHVAGFRPESYLEELIQTHFAADDAADPTAAENPSGDNQG